MASPATSSESAPTTKLIPRLGERHRTPGPASAARRAGHRTGHRHPWPRQALRRRHRRQGDRPRRPARLVLRPRRPERRGQDDHALDGDGLRPDAGQVFVLGHDVWGDPVGQLLGILPDGLQVFDRPHRPAAHRLRGPAPRAVPRGDGGPSRRAAPALGLTEARGKLVVDYLAGMTKKITWRPPSSTRRVSSSSTSRSEAVDPVSAATIRGTGGLRRRGAARSSSRATSWTSSSGSAPASP